MSNPLSLTSAYQILIAASSAYTADPDPVTADNLRAAQAAYKRAAAEAMTDSPRQAAAQVTAHLIALIPTPPSPEAEAEAAQAEARLTSAYDREDRAEYRLKHDRTPEAQAVYDQARRARDEAEAAYKAAQAKAYPAARQ